MKLIFSTHTHKNTKATDNYVAFIYFLFFTVTRHRRALAGGYDKYGMRPKAFVNKKMKFNDAIAKRLEYTQIENNDACKVITSRDADDAFHYVDPPYINSDQGHYDGYTETNYVKLLDTLSTIKGKFLLSSYPSDILEEYSKKYGWHTMMIDKPLAASNGAHQKKRKRKVEILTANYPI